MRRVRKGGSGIEVIFLSVFGVLSRENCTQKRRERKDAGYKLFTILCTPFLLN